MFDIRVPEKAAITMKYQKYCNALNSAFAKDVAPEPKFEIAALIVAGKDFIVRTYYTVPNSGGLLAFTFSLLTHHGTQLGKAQRKLSKWMIEEVR